jgi:hypothetical protein
MKPKILTIFPLPAERYVAVQSALKEGVSSGRPEALEPATGSVNVLPSIESLILRKLLAEVEARQITRVQPTYVIEQPPPGRHITPIRTLCCLLWAASIALTALTVKYVDSQTIIPKSNDSQSRSLETLTASIVHQNEAFAMIIGSFQQLAGTVASSAKRTEAMPEMLARLANHLQQMRPPTVKETPELAVQPQMPQMLGTSPRKDDSAPISMGGIFIGIFIPRSNGQWYRLMWWHTITPPERSIIGWCRACNRACRRWSKWCRLCKTIPEHSSTTSRKSKTTP